MTESPTESPAPGAATLSVEQRQTINGWLDRIQLTPRRLSLTAAAADDAPADDVAEGALSPIWDDASASAIDQVTALILELRQLGDPEFDRMADDILQAVQRPLSNVSEFLAEFDQLSGEERAGLREEALDLIRREQAAIGGDALLRAADTNPLGVSCRLTATLKAALAEIERALQS